MIKYMVLVEGEGLINNDLTTFAQQPHPDVKIWDDPLTAKEYWEYNYSNDECFAVPCVLVPVPLTPPETESKAA